MTGVLFSRRSLSVFVLLLVCGRLPGPVGAAYYPIWSPAYVSFFGFGGRHFGFGVGFGFGSIGWCPIGPYDFYHPWYGRGFHNSYNAVNITNITNITNINNRGGQLGRPMTPLAAGCCASGACPY